MIKLKYDATVDDLKAFCYVLFDTLDVLQTQHNWGRDSLIIRFEHPVTGDVAMYEYPGESVHNKPFIDLLNSYIEPKKTNWDERMLRYVLGEINTWSKDPSTKVSAAIFKGKYPMVSSYNGFPPGVEDSDERLNNRDVKLTLVQHAEANAICTSAKLGICTDGCSIAVSHYPCSTCAGMIVSAGIKKVVTRMPSPEFIARWKDSYDTAALILKEAGIEVVVLELKD
jgi:dCMP deaminase